ncbi:MAG: ExsB family transcriptional regulator [Candidatus Omnitrophica bacterium 4484_213]|nr:MAG: ExsB family transcriptional regulator [Candidatus Omnitrophica bacterium 4484_213]
MNFDVKKFIERESGKLRKKVGEERAIVATSGGVDSTACAVLAHRVLGNKLKVIFINDGLMRQDEGKSIKALLNKNGINLLILNKQRQFFTSLKGLIDPEEKRKAFRDIFYKVLGRAIKEWRTKFLIQGTIAADIVETKKKIKTQHNVLSQIKIDPSKYGLEIIEPLKTIYKPEVRLVAKALGLPAQIYKRMPFPGPGLLCRIVGEVTPQRVKIVREATQIVEKHLKPLRPFQAFAVLLSDKATGISKGKRLLGDIIVIRSVESEKALKAKPTQIPYSILNKLQKEITKNIPSVVKILYDLTPKPPSTIEYI